MPLTAVQIEQRIANILTHPKMWGGAEAVELQVLLLMELLVFLNLPQSEDVTRPRMWLMTKYRAFLEEHIRPPDCYLISGRIVDVDNVAICLSNFNTFLKREFEEMKKLS